MARKETITQSDILQAAFEMVKEEGYENVTARKLAARAGCSTQPIFRVYRNMEELLKELFFIAVDYFETYYENFPKYNDIPFVDLGLTYIRFAEENKNLFRLLFLSKRRYEKSLYDLLNGKKGAVVREINYAKEYGCMSPEDMFTKMWIFIHGAACMTLTGDYDLEEIETVKLLEDSFRSFLK
ncbi:TetR/AcrR family transcriptional regulator [Kineothrix sp. MB12-C1]|uniref:TetR/AcrR family transcriptional regulator n=1 Tax=Kineothrix sp. MB12-C1 TaxID=3070215 RepID=UPI0027D29DEA|nr:TetR/AcrR family transcriptional regulator [Kineothrix sp. MB12-C1]WMC92412.1 TetR/AcrR family transcriptional regulator [Kineothrix sp. MB12-C1]